MPGPQVSKRPSIDSILADSEVQRKQDSLNRKNADMRNSKETPLSGGRLSGSGDKDPPSSGQEAVAAKMRQLSLKEKELESEMSFFFAKHFCQKVRSMETEISDWLLLRDAFEVSNMQWFEQPF